MRDWPVPLAVGAARRPPATLPAMRERPSSPVHPYPVGRPAFQAHQHTAVAICAQPVHPVQLAIVHQRQSFSLKFRRAEIGNERRFPRPLKAGNPLKQRPRRRTCGQPSPRRRSAAPIPATSATDPLMKRVFEKPCPSPFQPMICREGFWRSPPDR